MNCLMLKILIDKIMYGKDTCKYYSTHLWNLLLNDNTNSTYIV